jgi:hypothetical protein
LHQASASSEQAHFRVTLEALEFPQASDDVKAGAGRYYRTKWAANRVVETRQSAWSRLFEAEIS